MQFAEVFQAGTMLLERCIVHQHVEAAEFLHGARDGAAAELHIAHIAGNDQAAPAFGFDVLTRDFGVFRLVQVQYGDIGAFAGEQHGDGAAYARIAARDDGDHVFEFAAADIVRGEKARQRVKFEFVAGLLQVLLRQRVLRLFARAGLHRANRFFLALGAGAGGLLLLAVHRLLDTALAFDCCGSGGCGRRFLAGHCLSSSRYVQTGRRKSDASAMAAQRRQKPPLDLQNARLVYRLSCSLRGAAGACARAGRLCQSGKKEKYR